MDGDEVIRQLLATWDRHNDTLLYLLDNVPAEGFRAVPTASRGRDVARQFAHLHRVRLGWLHYHATGQRPSRPRSGTRRAPTRAGLKKALGESGRRVARFLDQGLRGQRRPRLFGRQIVRWMGYLIAHESHHKGQIMLALKRAGLRLPERVAVQGLWGRWIWK